MKWEQQISGCFGTADKMFALQRSDGERALRLLAVLYRNQVDWLSAESAFRSYLQTELRSSEASREHIQKHIQTQMARVRVYFKPWLS